MKWGSILILLVISTALACGSTDTNLRDEVDSSLIQGGTEIQEAGESDTDRDGIADPEDNCPSFENADQADLDDDSLGDVCDDDSDGDGTINLNDPCPTMHGNLCPQA